MIAADEFCFGFCFDPSFVVGHLLDLLALAERLRFFQIELMKLFGFTLGGISFMAIY